VGFSYVQQDGGITAAPSVPTSIWMRPSRPLCSAPTGSRFISNGTVWPERFENTSCSTICNPLIRYNQIGVFLLRAPSFDLPGRIALHRRMCTLVWENRDLSGFPVFQFLAMGGRTEQKPFAPKDSAKISCSFDISSSLLLLRGNPDII